MDSERWRTDMRFRSRHQEGQKTDRGGWQLGTSISKSIWGGVDYVDQVKTTIDQVNRRRKKIWWLGGQGRQWRVLRSWGRRSGYSSLGGLVACDSKPLVDGFSGLGFKTRFDFWRERGEARGIIEKLASKWSKLWRAHGHRMDKSQVGPLCPWS
jgi:hypothetical protein